MKKTRLTFSILFLSILTLISSKSLCMLHEGLVANIKETKKTKKIIFSKCKTKILQNYEDSSFCIYDIENNCKKILEGIFENITYFEISKNNTYAIIFGEPTPTRFYEPYGALQAYNIITQKPIFKEKSIIKKNTPKPLKNIAKNSIALLCDGQYLKVKTKKCHRKLYDLSNGKSIWNKKSKMVILDDRYIGAAKRNYYKTYCQIYDLENNMNPIFKSESTITTKIKDNNAFVLFENYSFEVYDLSNNGVPVLTIEKIKNFELICPQKKALYLEINFENGVRQFYDIHDNFKKIVHNIQYAKYRQFIDNFKYLLTHDRYNSKELKIYDTTNKFSPIIQSYADNFWKLPNKTHLLVVSGNTIQVYNIKNKFMPVFSKRLIHSQAKRYEEFVYKKKYLIIKNMQGLQVYDIRKNFKLIFEKKTQHIATNNSTYNSYNKKNNNIFFALDDKYLIIKFGDHTNYYYEIYDIKNNFTQILPNKRICNYRLTPPGQFLFAWHAHNSMQIYDIKNNNKPILKKPVDAVFYNTNFTINNWGNNKRICINTGQKNLQIYDFQSKKQYAKKIVNLKNAYQLEYSKIKNSNVVIASFESQNENIYETKILKLPTFEEKSYKKRLFKNTKYRDLTITLLSLE